LMRFDDGRQKEMSSEAALKARVFHPRRSGCRTSAPGPRACRPSSSRRPSARRSSRRPWRCTRSRSVSGARCGRGCRSSRSSMRRPRSTRCS
jgi:hypothetical protein